MHNSQWVLYICILLMVIPRVSYVWWCLLIPWNSFFFSVATIVLLYVANTKRGVLMTRNVHKRVQSIQTTSHPAPLTFIFAVYIVVRLLWFFFIFIFRILFCFNENSIKNIYKWFDSIIKSFECVYMYQFECTSPRHLPFIYLYTMYVLHIYAILKIKSQFKKKILAHSCGCCTNGGRKRVSVCGVWTYSFLSEPYIIYFFSVIAQRFVGFMIFFWLLWIWLSIKG